MSANSPPKEMCCINISNEMLIFKVPFNRNLLNPHNQQQWERSSSETPKQGFKATFCASHQGLLGQRREQHGLHFLLLGFEGVTVRTSSRTEDSGGTMSFLSVSQFPPGSNKKSLHLALINNCHFFFLHF